MSFSVVSKGEYTYKQTNEYLSVERYLIIRKKGRRYLLLNFNNKLSDNLTAVTLQIDQFDARGNFLGVVNAEFGDLAFGQGKFVLKEDVEIHRACMDFKVKILRAEYGDFVYRLGENQIYTAYEKKEVKKPVNRKAIERQVGKEGVVATHRRFTTPIAVSIFAFIIVLASMAAIFLHFNIFKKNESSFFIANVEYAFASENKDDGAPVYVIGSVGLGADNIVIPAVVEGHPVTHVAQGAFKDNSRIRKLTVNGDVLIEKEAFSGCSNLTSVTLNGVSTVQDRAFSSCMQLNSFSANGLTVLGESALNNCVQLNTVTIKNNLNDSPLTLGDRVFANCGQDIDTVVIDQYIKYGETCNYFSGVSNIVNLSLKNYGVKEYETVENSDKPLYLLFGASGNGNFTATISNLTIEYMDSIPAHFTKNVGSGLVSFTVKNLKQSRVGESAFEGNASLEQVNFPIKITKIGTKAFAGTKISSFDGSSFSEIGVSAFENCAELKDVGTLFTTPLKVVPENAFKGCAKLVQFTVPVTVNSIEKSAFSNSGLTAISFAEESEISEIKEQTFSNCTALKEITLPVKAEKICNEAFADCSALKTVNFPDELSTIQDNAFANCTAMQSITLPLGLNNVGNHVFVGCSGLTSLVIPNEVASIGYGMLYGANAIQTLTVPFIGEDENPEKTALGYFFGTETEYDNILVPQSLTTVNLTKGTTIYNGTFKNCYSLTQINLPDSIMYIGEEAFYSCANLAQFVMPKNTYTINNSAFANCTNLRSIGMSDNIIKIKANAFANCVNLRSLTLPSVLEEVGAGAFENCYRLFEVTKLCSLADVGGATDSAIKVYNSLDETPMERVYVNGYVIAKDDNSVWHLIDHAQASTLSLPAVTEGYKIPAKYFSEDASLKEVSISASVVELGDFAFTNNSELTSVTFVGGNVELGSAVFSNCSSLSVFNMNNATSSNLPRNTFENSISIKELYLPCGIVSIPSQMFMNYNNLTTVKIDAKFIGSEAFYSCYNLKTVVLTNVEAIGDEAFYYCSSLEGISFPTTLTEVGSSVFMYCSSLSNISIPSSVEELGNYVFSNTKLSSINLSGCGELKTIPSNAFNNCGSLNAISLPQGLDDIGDYAFSNCYSLTAITIPSTVTSIGDYSFNYCSSLTAVSIPGSAKSIGYSAFYGCSKLASVSLAEGISVIDDYAFGSCVALTEIVLPGSLTYMGDYVFSGCSALATLTISNGISETAFSYNTFLGLNNLHQVYNLSSIDIEVGDYSYGYLAYYAIVVSGSGDQRLKTVVTDDGYKFKYNNQICAFVGYEGNASSIEIGNEVTLDGKKFDEYVIASNTSLNYSIKKITIKSCVTEIRYNAFSGGVSLLVFEGAKIALDNYISSNYLLSVIVDKNIICISDDAFGGYSTTIYYNGSKSEWNSNSNKGNYSSYFTPDYYYVDCVHESAQWTYSDTGWPTTTQSDIDERIKESATCTKDGTKETYCTQCNHVFSTSSIPKLGHLHLDGICSRCGHVPEVAVKKATLEQVGSIININSTDFDLFNQNTSQIRSTNEEAGSVATVIITALTDVKISFNYRVANAIGSVDYITMTDGINELTFSKATSGIKTWSLKNGQTLTITFTRDAENTTALAYAVLQNIKIGTDLA